MPGPRRTDHVVVVVLDYSKRYAKATISFSGARPDHAVLAAKTETVPGVSTVMSAMSPGPQELEF